ncbi:hypothetical protein DSO57_1030959 [Entomophthora muscae]|uniref:Uncharacterized protein n=1 Tax=Entomophthora muscae TaxID=34485 RepID=A0ACC2UKM4_9FUNG|nr:hypothetical protein DSO57_1030959 [Entomophthora muscae]
MYRLPGAPFGPVHFTEYPLKPEYKDYTANNILAWDPLARTTELTRNNQEGPWYITKPRLFRDKYNFLPIYQMDMEPPVTPKPIPASAAELPLDHTNKLFGIVYITLTGVIDTIVPAASPLKFCGPPLALDWDVFPRLSKKWPTCSQNPSKTWRTWSTQWMNTLCWPSWPKFPFLLWSPLQLRRRH